MTLTLNDSIPSARSWPQRPLAERSGPLAPWSTDSLARVLTANGVGLALILVSWYQTSGQLLVRDQLAWLIVGLVGLGIEGFANGLWMLRGRQSIGFALAGLPALGRTIQLPAVEESTDDGPLVAGPRMSHYHKPSCAFVHGRETRTATRAAHERSRLRSCEVCQP